MHGRLKGFTLVETTLVLAISVAVFVALAAGIAGDIARRRYDSAGTEMADFLRNVYSEVDNIENARIGEIGSRTYCTLDSSIGGSGKNIAAKITDPTNNTNNVTTAPYGYYPGRTNCSIYGKAIIFGANNGKVYVFDVVGDAVEYTPNTDQNADDGTVFYLDIHNKSFLDSLKAVHLDYLSLDDSTSGCSVMPAASYTSYTPNWGGSIDTTDGKPFVGMALIVRSPNNGNINTYIYYGDESDRPDIDSLINFDIAVQNCNNGNGIDASNYGNIISSHHFWTGDSADNYLDGFKNNESELGFCLNSSDIFAAGGRKYISILAGGSNSSAVKVYEDEEGRQKCQ